MLYRLVIIYTMPTKLDRVQVLFQKDLFNKLKMIAKIERRSLSSMVSSIVEYAFESEKYKLLIEKAKQKDVHSKIDQSKLLVKDILRPNTSKSLDFDISVKLSKIDKLLSGISNSNQKENNNKPTENKSDFKQSNINQEVFLND